MGNGLKATSTKRTGTYLRAMLQWTVKSRVVVRQQIDICLKATNTQQTGNYPRVVLQ